MEIFKQFYRQITGQLTPTEIAARELAQAEHAKLEAESALEYAVAMVDYNNSRIERLRGYMSSSQPVVTKAESLPPSFSRRAIEPM